MPTGHYKRKKKKEHKPREPKAPPEMFGVQLTVPDSQLGLLLRATANLKGVTVNGVSPIEVRERAKNLPTHSWRDAAIEIIRKKGGSIFMPDLKELLINLGFAAQRNHSAVGDAVRLGNLKKDAKDNISLGKWKDN